jgi:hypothetical protein
VLAVGELLVSSVSRASGFAACRKTVSALQRLKAFSPKEM